MTSIEGIELYPMISLLIFIAFFSFLIFYVIRMSKAHVDEMKNYPLEED